MRMVFVALSSILRTQAVFTKPAKVFPPGQRLWSHRPMYLGTVFMSHIYMWRMANSRRIFSPSHYPLHHLHLDSSSSLLYIFLNLSTESPALQFITMANWYCVCDSLTTISCFRSVVENHRLTVPS